MREIIVYSDTIKLDNGVFFGQGIFETIFFGEAPYFLDFHINRLKQGLKALDMKPLIEEDKVLEYINKLGIKNKVLKITVTEKNIILTTRENIYTEEMHEKGFSLKISKVLRNSTSILPRIKSTNYIENILEKRNGAKEGYDDVIFFNEKGFLCETSVSNIFCIKDNKIYTPSCYNGLLNGTIRDWIINNFEVIECDITMKDLKSMDEVFVTNSLLGIMKVKSIEDLQFNKNVITKSIRDRYKKYIVSEYGGKRIYD